MWGVVGGVLSKLWLCIGFAGFVVLETPYDVAPLINHFLLNKRSLRKSYFLRAVLCTACFYISWVIHVKYFSYNNYSRPLMYCVH